VVYLPGEKKVNDAEFPTIIGPDAKFKGELNFEKGVKIMGGFEGRITTAGVLVVAPEGMIQADVEAGTVTVEGEISGNVSAKDLVELKNTAKLHGDLQCERLIVIDGARFTGHCNVGNGATSQPGKAAAAKPVTKPQSQL
jgi:cytoskeletal protein CcmA (bactofilin family)